MMFEKMFRKQYYTIVISPDQGFRLKKVRISNHALFCVGLATLFLLTVAVSMIATYFDVQIKALEVYALMDENLQYTEELEGFQEEYAALSANVLSLTEIETELMSIACSDDDFTGEDLFGIGGPMGDDSMIGREKPDQDEIISELKSEIELLEEKARIREESLQELFSFLEEQENLLACTPSVWPTRGFVTSGFGYRWGRMHEGIDIANRPGTPIYAPADGIVTFSGIKGGYGKFVVVSHGFGYHTAYGHLYSIDVKEGDFLKRGDYIGTLGNTGRTTGPHLHYEVHVNGVPVNPVLFILN
ncbi:MAG: M23 family metallopeptidase [Deltaproteobacteria bacterium]|nr:M23 family metallopeptidase [Candidatus Zymogenaceae bacterium]